MFRILVLTFFAFFNIFHITERHLTTIVEAPRNPYEKCQNIERFSSSVPQKNVKTAENVSFNIFRFLVLTFFAFSTFSYRTAPFIWGMRPSVWTF